MSAFSDEDLEVPYPHYQCPICGDELPVPEARVTVTCARHHEGQAVEFEVRDARSADKSAIEEICDRAWGETEIDVFGRTFDVLALDDIVAVSDGELLGLVSLAVHGGELAIVLLSVYPRYQGAGVGRALIQAADVRAREKGLPFMKASASNDDVPSLYFYMRQGFVIYDIAIGTIADSLGTASPGFAGIPIRDEVRLRKPVDGCD